MGPIPVRPWPARRAPLVSAAGRACLPLLAASLCLPALAGAQDRPVGWQRGEAPTAVPVTVFHSTQSANLPTVETLSAGELLFEIAHRSETPISRGVDALWGLDGTIRMRLGLAYAATDRLMLGVIRSNDFDNLELNAKARLFAVGGALPVLVGAMGGVAFNTETPDIVGFDENETQAYGQVMVNAAFGDAFALGVVPTLVWNPSLEAVDAEGSFALGAHGQWFVSQHVSFLAEYVATEATAELPHDALTFGVDLETGGHFFKIVVTNQDRMNATQWLGGTRFPIALDQMRVGFNITRILRF